MTRSEKALYAQGYRAGSPMSEDNPKISISLSKYEKNFWRWGYRTAGFGLPSILEPSK